MARLAKITYVSLGADDPALDAAFDAAIAQGARRAGADPPASRRGQDARGRGADREPQPRRHARRRGPRRQRDASRRARRRRRRQGRLPGWRRTPWQERAEILGRAADHLASRASSSRPGSSTRWARTASRRWARSRRPPTSSPTTPSRCGPTTATCARWGGSAHRHQHQRAAPVRRLGGDRPLELPLRAARRAHRGGAGHRQHGGGEAVVGHAAVGRASWRRSSRRRAAAAAPSTCLPGSGRVVGDGLRDHPDLAGADLHRLVRRRLHAALQEVLARATPSPASSRWAARTRRIVMDSADLERGRPGRLPLGLRHERPQVLGLLARLRAPGRRRRVPGGWRSRPRRTRIGDPLDKGDFVGPLATQASYDDYQRFMALARAAGPDACAPAASCCTEGALRPRLLRAAHHPGRLPRDHELMRDGAVRPHPGRRGGRQPGRGAGAGQRHQVRADRRAVLAQAGARSTPSSSASRRASSTSTAPPAPPPAPGRACSRSAAGRAAARRARTSAASTRCPATCASRAGRWCT